MKTIKNITLKYPELLSADAAVIIENLITSLEEKEDKRAELTVTLLKLEEEIKKDKAKLKELSGLFEIKYEEEEFTEIKEDVSLRIVNKTDARNL